MLGNHVLAVHAARGLSSSAHTVSAPLTALESGRQRRGVQAWRLVRRVCRRVSVHTGNPRTSGR